MCKMLLVVALPVVTLITLSALNLAQARVLQVQTTAAQETIDRILKVDDLVTDLQVERGTTATYLSSGGANIDAYERLLDKRRSTDASVENLRYPTEGLVVSEVFLPTKESFSSFLKDYRKTVRNGDITFEYNIRLYTNITFALMDWSETIIELPERGVIWPLAIASASMLRASDAIGIHRALGATFFTLCRFTTANQSWFTYLEGEASALLNVSFTYSIKSRVKYESEYQGSQLYDEINTQKGYMYNESYFDSCALLSDAIKYDNSLTWFQNLTSYIILIKRIRGSLTDDLVTALKQ
ncbi:hypothetical protein CAPTEDRAFT_197422, partial [Capitella teleta]